MKPLRTCILVADGMHARVFVNEGPDKGITERPEYAEAAELQPSRDIDADRPGRTFDSGGQGRHAMEPPTDAKRHVKQEFHRHIAQKIGTAATQGKFDRLVLVAAPATLGDLRAEFDKLASVNIYAAIDKNLIKANDQELLAQLGQVLAA